jgi:hypothetical protein
MPRYTLRASNSSDAAYLDAPTVLNAFKHAVNLKTLCPTQ